MEAEVRVWDLRPWRRKGWGRLNSEMKSDKVKGHREGVRQARGHRGHRAIGHKEGCEAGSEVTGKSMGWGQRSKGRV